MHLRVTDAKEALLKRHEKKVNPSFLRLLEAPEVRTWRAIMKAQKEVLSVLESAFHKRGYTVARFEITFFLYFEGPQPPSAIAQSLCVTRGNITAFLKRLRKDGIVEAVSGITEGRPHYALTKHGRTDFESIFPEHVARIKKIVPPLDKRTLLHLQALADSAALWSGLPGKESAD